LGKIACTAEKLKQKSPTSSAKRLIEKSIPFMKLHYHEKTTKETCTCIFDMVPIAPGIAFCIMDRLRNRFI